MNPSDKIIAEKKEAENVIDKVYPAIVEMLQRADSGEITIYFHEGKFKRAKKTVTV
jgi:hypothetical protein